MFTGLPSTCFQVQAVMLLYNVWTSICLLLHRESGCSKLLDREDSNVGVAPLQAQRMCKSQVQAAVHPTNKTVHMLHQFFKLKSYFSGAAFLCIHGCCSFEDRTLHSLQGGCP
ncbi:hypothetical protein LR48_Vigan05g037100 [Vigna angularis]|uniref:Uncharacterized protein n=2 Tax=Phaseolus angularis TaxID=3914 RepID=A0A0L9UJM0_PHAAN|nr:hypothetical protein LR48_Vigan05g037100 [Vigna angularis]BAU03147.1 hypothetical protein VIGAN_UM021100 [Vigna angularis var. angularis]